MKYKFNQTISTNITSLKFNNISNTKNYEFSHIIPTNINSLKFHMWLNKNFQL